MTITKIILAGTAVTIIGSAAFAQEALTGTVTQVDRIHRTVTVRQTQAGTVGANQQGSAAEEFRVQDGLSLEAVHAGDKVTFSASQAGGAKTITKFQPK